MGINFEKSGNMLKAIDLYEANILDGFDGNHPYDRLAIIYKKQQRIDDEIRVLEKAIEVFGKNKNSERNDQLIKLRKFEDRLIKAQNRRAVDSN